MYKYYVDLKGPGIDIKCLLVDTYLYRGAGVIDHIYSNSYAFAALKTDGTVITWGRGISGRDITPLLKELTFIDDIKVKDNFFIAFKSNGIAVQWKSDSFFTFKLPLQFLKASALKEHVYLYLDGSIKL
ncbi:MAG: hypothetical protein ACRBBP_10375 [Bdellovibrionales bacterium]